MSRVPAYLYHKDNAPKVFETEEELDSAMEDGWVDSPEKVDARATHGPISKPEGLSDEQWGSLDALRAYAKEIGIALGPKIKIETLQAKVAEATKGQE